jgi:hypothetical protein
MKKTEKKPPVNTDVNLKLRAEDIGALYAFKEDILRSVGPGFEQSFNRIFKAIEKKMSTKLQTFTPTLENP